MTKPSTTVCGNQGALFVKRLSPTCFVLQRRRLSLMGCDWYGTYSTEKAARKAYAEARNES